MYIDIDTLITTISLHQQPSGLNPTDRSTLAVRQGSAEGLGFRVKGFRGYGFRG